VTRERVRISADAEAQLTAIRTWWIENRPLAHDLLDEFDAAVAAIASGPRGFPIYRRESGADVRRAFLPKTRYAV
jgi:hypothetical protein